MSASNVFGKKRGQLQVDNATLLFIWTEGYSIAATTMATNPAAPYCATSRRGAAPLKAAVLEAAGTPVFAAVAVNMLVVPIAPVDCIVTLL